jgi:hypothetical protein
MPVDVELSLVDSIPHPVETHVDGSLVLLLDVVIGDATCHRIVRLYWSSRLRVPHFLQSSSKYRRSFGVVKKGADFGL